MKTTTLVMDHYENTATGVIVHKAGTTVTLTDEEVDYIHRAVLEKRKVMRQAALLRPGMPEYERAR